MAHYSALGLGCQAEEYRGEENVHVQKSSIILADAKFVILDHCFLK